MNVSLAALAALTLTAPQAPPNKAEPGPLTFKPIETTVAVRPPTEIRVGPMPLPVPLLEVELWPAQTDAGDALPLYLAAMRAQPRRTPEQLKEYNAAYDILSDKPPGKATPADLALVRRVLEPEAGAMRLAARAARVRQCDWSPLVSPAPGGVHANMSAVLECVQGFRGLAFAFRARAYLARAAGDHSAALADAATTVGMARHVNAGETAIHHLVACAVTQVALQQARQIAEDGGPNLLAAALELPRPLVPSAAATRRELDTLVGAYPPLGKVAGKLTADDARKLVAETHAKLLAAARQDGPPPPGAGAGPLAALAMNLFSRPDTGPVTKRLADLGYPPERTAGMPADQLFLLDATARLRRAADAARLAATLPPGHPLLAALPAPPAPKPYTPGVTLHLPTNEHPAQVGLTLLRLTAPALAKVRDAQTRVDFTVATLAFTEALRAELAKPGAAWGPALLDAPLVKATAFPAKWDAAGKAFTATDPGVGAERFRWVAKP